MSRQTIINVAAAEVGTKEYPAESNCTKYGEWFGLNGAKWCAIFVSWVYAKALHPLGYIDMPKGYAGCQAGYEHWKKLDLLTDTPQMGDIVLYDWDNDDHCDHTGIFFQWTVEGQTFESYEGNTSVGNNSNGGEVMLRTRNMGSVKAFASVL
ncbi:CHAP domain-containing protein [Mucilaginibacter sp. OK098]|uniref:CHAP domain-containing protein n=1 Tax=Mucilaginibacter sp. OK098 TaxID=1855297 RepID=UPI000918AE27|nr:CHAP domain-containing protein [Mucilaginibacter sp. OK098]SHN07421.1 CHAP domain-containing protein [Mucilaginibacter sp. OK098]